jgi:hypothetical protein
VQDVEVGHLDVAPLVLRPLVSGDRLGSRTEEETQGERDQAGRESCASECVNNFETPVAGGLVSNAAVPRVRAAWVLEG